MFSWSRYVEENLVKVFLESSTQLFTISKLFVQLAQKEEKVLDTKLHTKIRVQKS